MTWFWEDEGSESDTESVSESGPDSDTDDSITNENADNGHDASVLLSPGPVPGGSRRRPRAEEEDKEEDWRARKQFKH